MFGITTGVSLVTGYRFIEALADIQPFGENNVEIKHNNSINESRRTL